MDKKTFLARRKSGIGGSDIAAIAGISPWKSPLDVFLDKTAPENEMDYQESFPQGRKAALYWGSVAEDNIAKAYTLVTGRKVMRYNRLLQHPDHPHFIGDVDFLGYRDNGGHPFNFKTGEIFTTKGIECKTSRYADEWGENGSDEIPVHYICQVQWYMGLLPTLQSFDVPTLFTGSDFRIYTIHRHDAIIARLQEVGDYFWLNHVVKQVAPPPRTTEEVIKLFSQSEASSIVATVEVEKAAIRFSELAAAISKLEVESAQAKDAITTYMKQHEALELPDGTPLATFKTSKNGQRRFIVKNNAKAK